MKSQSPRPPRIPPSEIGHPGKIWDIHCVYNVPSAHWLHLVERYR